MFEVFFLPSLRICFVHQALGTAQNKLRIYFCAILMAFKGLYNHWAMRSNGIGLCKHIFRRPDFKKVINLSKRVGVENLIWDGFVFLKQGEVIVLHQLNACTMYSIFCSVFAYLM